MHPQLVGLRVEHRVKTRGCVFLDVFAILLGVPPLLIDTDRKIFPLHPRGKAQQLKTLVAAAPDEPFIVEGGPCSYCEDVNEAGYPELTREK